MKQQHRIKAAVDEAADTLRLLKSAKFFFTYPRFHSTASEFSDKFAHYLDYSNKYMEYAAQDYFSKLLDDTPENPQVQTQCRPKEHSGVQVSFMS